MATVIPPHVTVRESPSTSLALDVFTFTAAPATEQGHWMNGVKA